MQWTCGNKRREDRIIRPGKREVRGRKRPIAGCDPAVVGGEVGDDWGYVRGGNALDVRVENQNGCRDLVPEGRKNERKTRRVSRDRYAFSRFRQDTRRSPPLLWEVFGHLFCIPRDSAVTIIDRWRSGIFAKLFSTENQREFITSDSYPCTYVCTRSCGVIVLVWLSSVACPSSAYVYSRNRENSEALSYFRPFYWTPERTRGGQGRKTTIIGLIFHTL